MDFETARNDEVAQALARKSFSYHVMFDEIGPLDDEATDRIREALTRLWEDAGSPPGAVRRATVLSAQLPQRIADDEDADALAVEGVSRERQVTLAERADAFLISLAAEIDQQPA